MSMTSDLTQTARSHAEDLRDKVASDLEHGARSTATDAKDAAADKFENTAAAASAAASQLDPQSPQTQAVQQIADQIEGLAHGLRTTDVSTLASEATAIARRHPALFCGGAVLAGFAIARFFKAQDPSTVGRAWNAQPQYRSDLNV